MSKLKPRTVHIHIPKCAGNSLFRSFCKATNSKKNMMQDSIAIYKSTECIKKYESQDEFEKSLLINKQTLLAFHLSQNFSSIGGHFAFSPLIHSSFRSEVNFFTLLREPVKRLKSHVSYLLLSHPRTCTEDYINGKLNVEDEVSRLLNGPKSKWLGRQQCLYLGGLNSKGEADLDHCVMNAIESLSLFDLVGFVDKFDDFCDSFQSKYEQILPQLSLNTIEDVALEKLEVLEKIKSALDDSEDRIRDLSKWDSILYNYAITNFL